MPRVRAAIRPPADAPPAPEGSGSAMPTKRPPVRRASSASSVQALPPTPPRTTHKRKRRSRSRVTDSSSEDDDDHDVPEPEPEQDRDRDHKRRKMSSLEAIAEELSETRAEEQFWLGGAASSSKAVAGPSSSPQKRKIVKDRAPTRPRSRAMSRSRSVTRSPSPPPAPHLLTRGHTGLFSPPPSRRAPAIVPRPATPPPSTRPQRVKDKVKAEGYPERDSPNNPFLLDSSPGSVPATDSSPEPHTPKKHVEKPTITVVIRGVRAQMLNPHYVPEDVAAEAEARARLPVRHPDFSPTDACAPKLLFPEARKHDHASRRRERAPIAVPEPGSPTPGASTSTSKSASKFTSTSKSKRSRAGSASSDDPRPGPSTLPEDEADVEAMSAAIAANIARRKREGALAGGEVPKTRPSSRLGELPDMPELPAKDRSDPVKRALGPARRG